MASYRVLRPFAEFFRTEAAGGVVLIACAAIALAWANSPFAASYARLWATPVAIGAGDYVLNEPLLFWVNDALMAIFFLLVGLEIKREVMGGELGSPRKAALPLLAALGGMLVPAGIYAAFNAGGEGARGWGIPMATDIAFSLGVLALLGRRAPLALKVFLTALAIADDLGAVLVIALFYGHGAHLEAFAWAAGILAALLLLNRMGVRRLGPYLVGGVALWIAVHASGVHATVAGVLLALTIPARRRSDAVGFLREARHYLDAYGAGFQPPRADPTPEQLDAVHALEEACEGVQTPLRRIEHDLHGPVAFGIMPVFALANAGVGIEGGVGPLLTHPVSLGVLAGLVIGKPLGVFIFSFLAVKLGLAEKPAGVSWRQLLGVSALAGIGFTMSIFIATLAFPDAPGLLDSAKVGILLGSAASAALGWGLLSTAPSGSSPGEGEACAARESAMS
ncbi:MAG TPA: Na+/H+ antiporter NhaA [Rhodothermales bacterium]|nr:Na+/H+ antiporter NhaA [Rhodothermales bacterium]